MASFKKHGPGTETNIECNIEQWLSYIRKFGSNPFHINQWGQAKGTDVLIFSMGDTTMEMGLSFPLNKADAGDRTVYVQPNGMRIPLQPGSCLVYSALDDLFFCHEVAFPTEYQEDVDGNSGYRVAFVFRWLNESERHEYYVDDMST